MIEGIERVTSEIEVAKRLVKEDAGYYGIFFERWADRWLDGTDRSAEAANKAYLNARCARYGNYRAQAAMHAAVMAVSLVEPDYKPWTGPREEYYSFHFPSDLERQLNSPSEIEKELRNRGQLLP